MEINTLDKKFTHRPIAKQQPRSLLYYLFSESANLSQTDLPFHRHCLPPVRQENFHFLFVTKNVSHICRSEWSYSFKVIVLKGQYCQELERIRMISVSPLAVEDVEVVTLELEEDSAKVAPALEQVEDEEEDDIVEVGRAIIITYYYMISWRWG